MSGIGVIFHRNGRPVDRREVERMMRSLSVYGPEHQSSRQAGSVAFAYAHLTNTPESKFDNQPLQGGDGRYTLVFDGRIDNRDELIALLRITPDGAKRLSDAALALKTWEVWRQDAFERWVGDFAFILWDSSEQKI